VSRKTNALRLLDRAGVDYDVLEYSLTMDEFSAEAVAAQLGLPPGQIFKTLLARTESGPCFAVIPAGTELDLKALARAVGERRAEMVPVGEVERLTGYRRGAVTVPAAKKTFPAVIDESVAAWDRIGVSAGAQGLQVLLAAADYLAITGATPAPVARPR
jgi:Cys-tRNA(Pro)/Cys-tRNA(Cys) deacylase